MYSHIDQYMANLLKNDPGAPKRGDVALQSFEHAYAAASCDAALEAPEKIEKAQPNVVTCSPPRAEAQNTDVCEVAGRQSIGLRWAQPIDTTANDTEEGDQKNWLRQQPRRQQPFNDENMKELDDGGGCGYDELSSEFLCNFSSDDCDRFVRYYWDYKSGKLLSRRNNRKNVEKV